MRNLLADAMYLLSRGLRKLIKYCANNLKVTTTIALYSATLELLLFYSNLGIHSYRDFPLTNTNMKSIENSIFVFEFSH